MQPSQDISQSKICQQFNLSHKAGEKLISYVQLLEFWQKTHNLVAHGDLKRLWKRHIQDSLMLLQYLPQMSCHIADLGSGAGFPAIPIAIARAENMTDTLDLVEKNYKKAAFLREVIRQNQIQATLYPCKIEKYCKIQRKSHPNIITARALASVSKLLEYTYPFIKNGAKAFFFKGQNVDNELTEAKKYWTIIYDLYYKEREAGTLLIVREAYPIR